MHCPQFDRWVGKLRRGGHCCDSRYGAACDLLLLLLLLLPLLHEKLLLLELKLQKRL